MERVRVPLPHPCPVVIVDSATTEVLHAALRGLAQRQRVISDNIANVQTPGFLAGTVDFEDSLRDAVADGGADAMARTVPTVARDWQTPTNVNGNNVNLDDQTVQATETGLRYQLALRAMDDQFTLLRTATK